MNSNKPESGEKFIVQTITYFTAKILERNQFGTYDEVATVQGSGARGDALRLAKMLNTATDHPRDPVSPL